MKKILQPAILLTDISKKYEIHHEKPTLVEKFIHGRNETFWALQRINMRVYPNERVAIIGANGSGKTTLLKIICGIATPTTGAIQISGKIVSLIDIVAGFQSDLTGYQNIFINGLLIGMTEQEIMHNIDSIISFADIKQFIDVPFYTYSSGMALRLGFAIAIHAKPDILLIDEGLGVGDKNFQKKSERAIRTLLKKRITVIMVSHQLNLIKHICNRVIILNKGTITADGPIDILKQHGYE